MSLHFAIRAHLRKLLSALGAGKYFNEAGQNKVREGVRMGDSEAKKAESDGGDSNKPGSVPNIPRSVPELMNGAIDFVKSGGRGVNQMNMLSMPFCYFNYDIQINNVPGAPPRKHNKPHLVIQLDAARPNVPTLAEWFDQNNIRVLNVAGPRESKTPGVHQLACRFLDEFFQNGAVEP